MFCFVSCECNRLIWTAVVNEVMVDSNRIGINLIESATETEIKGYMILGAIRFSSVEINDALQSLQRGRQLTRMPGLPTNHKYFT